MLISFSHLLRLDPIIEMIQNMLDIILHEFCFHNQTLLFRTSQICLQGADDFIFVLLVAAQQVLQLLATEMCRK